MKRQYRGTGRYGNRVVSPKEDITFWYPDKEARDKDYSAHLNSWRVMGWKYNKISR